MTSMAPIRAGGSFNINQRITPPEAPKEQQELSESDKKTVDELRARDREVRRHEQAHKSAAGAHARGGPSYDYQRGPDGRLYAVGGEVSIDLTTVKGDPEATIRKMKQVRAAALAPAEPSGKDRSIASRALREINKAQQALRTDKNEASATDPASNRPHEIDLLA